MKIVTNKLLPFKGFEAMSLFGRIWTRHREENLSLTTINHELIHLSQEKELYYIGFYLWYILEWIYRSLQYLSFSKGYKNISFEREAYTNENNLNYLEERHSKSFIFYI